jgi:hypothetical protein
LEASNEKPNEPQDLEAGIAQPSEPQNPEADKGQPIEPISEPEPVRSFSQGEPSRFDFFPSDPPDPSSPYHTPLDEKSDPDGVNFQDFASYAGAGSEIERPPSRLGFSQLYQQSNRSFVHATEDAADIEPLDVEAKSKLPSATVREIPRPKRPFSPVERFLGSKRPMSAVEEFPVSKKADVRRSRSPQQEPDEVTPHVSEPQLTTPMQTEDVEPSMWMRGAIGPESRLYNATSSPSDNGIVEEKNEEADLENPESAKNKTTDAGMPKLKEGIAELSRPSVERGVPNTGSSTPEWLRSPARIRESQERNRQSQERYRLYQERYRKSQEHNATGATEENVGRPNRRTWRGPRGRVPRPESPQDDDHPSRPNCASQ